MCVIASLDGGREMGKGSLGRKDGDGNSTLPRSGGEGRARERKGDSLGQEPSQKLQSVHSGRRRCVVK